MNHSTQSPEARVLLPEVFADEKTSDTLILTLQIPADLSFFNGHFKQIPIVPGVVQIQWAAHFARQYLALNKEFRHMEAIKFKELLLSGQPLQLHLRYNDQLGKLDFCYRSDAQEYSSGRLYFHDHRV